MANRVKEVSAFDGTSWGSAVPLGANDSNIDITSSTTQPDGSAVSGVSGDSAIALDTSAVAVSEGDTGASAWTKFNRFRKRVANNFANYIQGSIATSYNATGSDSAVYSTNVLNNYMANVIGYSGTTAPSAGTVAAQLSSLNDNTFTTNGTQGYYQSYTGLLIQFGTISCTRKVGQNFNRATFQVPFATIPMAVCSASTSRPDLWYASIPQVTTTFIQVVLYNSGDALTGTLDLWWIAIGEK